MTREQRQRELENRGKPVLDLESDAVKDIVKLTKNIRDPETGEPDKMVKFIETVQVLAPIAAKFLQGMKSSMDSYQAQSAQPQRPTIKAPPGWEAMSPLQRITKKYSQPEWYAAGERWEAYNDGLIPDNVNINYVDPSYRPPKPQRLSDLQGKYPDPPLVRDTPIPEIVKPADQPDKGSTPPLPESGGSADLEEKTMEQQINEENARYVKLGIGFLNNLPIESFKEKVDDPVKLAGQIAPLMELLPVHVVDMVRNTTPEELEQVFKESCAEKYDWLVKENKLDKLRTLFDMIQKEIKVNTDKA